MPLAGGEIALIVGLALFLLYWLHRKKCLDGEIVFRILEIVFRLIILVASGGKAGGGGFGGKGGRSGGGGSSGGW